MTFAIVVRPSHLPPPPPPALDRPLERASAGARGPAGSRQQADGAQRLPLAETGQPLCFEVFIEKRQMRLVYSARLGQGHPTASSKSMMATRHMLPVMILLTLFYVGGKSSPAATGSTFVLSEPPSVINATNTSLTMRVDVDWCSECMIHWRYKIHEEKEESEKGKEKEKVEEHPWRSGGTAPAAEEHFIDGLQPETTYNVSATLMRDRDAQAQDVKGAPYTCTLASTCPSSPEMPQYLWTNERQQDLLQMSWGKPIHNCASNRYMIRWKSYDTEEDLTTNSSESSPACPTNAIMISNLSMVKCEHSTYRYCYTIKEDLTPTTRYYVEVATVDWTGACSELEDRQTATPMIFWRGVTFGMWTLIVLGVALLLAMAVTVFFIIKRKATRKLSIAEVAFSKEPQTTDGQYGDSDREADEYVFPEPVTRFEKKKDQQNN